MAQGKTNSVLPTHERIQRANELFAEGASIAQVARDLQIAWPTAQSYHKAWKEQSAKEASENSGILTDLVGNSIEALNANNKLMHEAWANYHKVRQESIVICEDCGGEVNVPAASSAVLQGWIDKIAKIQKQRAELLGLFGVKKDYIEQVNKNKKGMQAIINFIMSLDDKTKEKLIDFMQSPEMAELFGVPQMKQIPVDYDRSDILELESDDEDSLDYDDEF